LINYFINNLVNLVKILFNIKIYIKSKSFVIINGYIINIDRYYYESDEMFYFRINFIIEIFNKNNNLDDLDIIIGLSKIK